MASRQRDDPFPLGVQKRPGPDEQRAGPALDDRCKGGLDVAGGRGIENEELLPDRLRRGLHVASLRRGRRSVRVHERGNRRRLGHELPQQLQSLRPQHAAEKAHAGDVAARPVEAGDQALLDRVAAAPEDDRHRRGCGLGGERRIVVPDDHGHRPAEQIGHQGRQSISLIVRRAILDRDVLALDEARVLQALPERGHDLRRVSERAAEEPDHGRCRLLRARGKRPRHRCAAHERDEFPPSHVINSGRAISPLEKY